MNGQTKFEENEPKLILIAKQTMKVLAKVMKDLDPKEVIKDKNIADKIINEKKWKIDDPKTLAMALADNEIGPMIRERLTPDLPHLSPEQEAMVIGQLGATIFGELLKIEPDE
jgi:hypothetical protein